MHDSYARAQLVKMITQVNGVNPDSNGRVTIPSPSGVHAMITQFTRNGGETDDAPRIQRALNSLTNGGILEFEVAEYLIASTVTIPQNVTLRGQGCGKFTTGTSFRYVGAAAGVCFNITTGATAGIRLEDFKIYAKSGDPAYQNFTAILVNQGELMRFKDIMIQFANIGVDISGSTNDIYLLDIDTIYIYNCANEGILIRSTGSWKNGIRIKVGDISFNNIGIHALTGLGNSISGDGSEVGNNTAGGILIEGGVWTIKGNLWIENNGYGIQTTGGHTSILEDVYCSNPINQNGGTLYMPNKQAVVNFISPSMLKRNLVAWYSFEEGSGSATYDRVNSAKGTFSTAPTWNGTNGRFGSTITNAAGISVNFPPSTMDWTQDWTFLFLGYGSNSHSFLSVTGSDSISTLAFYPYPNGLQIYSNGAFKVNMATFPNGDATQKYNWHILSYTAATNTFTAYSQIGRAMSTYVMAVAAVMNAPTALSLGNSDAVDEFILYNRVLTDSEIRGICDLTVLPDVRNLNQKVMTSPDGSMWKQTIDNTGVATWTKL